jgi:hypothetical protein
MASQGTFPGLKAVGSDRYRSTLERDIRFLLEFDPTIHIYEREPFKIRATELLDGSVHTYKPDYRLERSSGYEIVECKYESQINDPESIQQCEIGLAWAAENGWIFRQVTDVQLRSGHVLTGLKRLWRYRHISVPQPWLGKCLKYLTEISTPISIQVLSTYLADPQTPLSHIPTILHLVFHHVLWLDLNQPITGDSLVSISAEKESLWDRLTRPLELSSISSNRFVSSSK